MDEAKRFEKPSMRRAWIGTGILLTTQFAAAIVTRRGAAVESAVIAAVMTGLSLFAIAALNVRHTPYPRWAYASMVAIMSAAIMLTLVTAVSLESWGKETRDSLWMFPWFLVLLSFTPAPKRGICAADNPRVGWLMVGTAVLLGGLLQLAGRLSIG